MKIQDALVGIFWLILAYLVFQNWRGVTQLLTSGSNAGNSTIKVLQGRG